MLWNILAKDGENVVEDFLKEIMVLIVDIEFSCTQMIHLFSLFHHIKIFHYLSQTHVAFFQTIIDGVQVLQKIFVHEVHLGIVVLRLIDMRYFYCKILLEMFRNLLLKRVKQCDLEFFLRNSFRLTGSKDLHRHSLSTFDYFILWKISRTSKVRF